LIPLDAERMLNVSPTAFHEEHVPVTARLSKRFYDVLGEDIANELVEWFNAVDLTYRADLRELNELNFARFDAKLEQRLAGLRAELRQAIAELRAELRQDIAGSRLEMGQEIHKLRTEMQHMRVELLRWMFGFWVTTLVTLAGLMFGLRGP
jgi:hypothetical protein